MPQYGPNVKGIILGSFFGHMNWGGGEEVGRIRDPRLNSLRSFSAKSLTGQAGIRGQGVVRAETGKRKENRGKLREHVYFLFSIWLYRSATSADYLSCSGPN